MGWDAESSAHMHVLYCIRFFKNINHPHIRGRSTLGSGARVPRQKPSKIRAYLAFHQILYGEG